MGRSAPHPSVPPLKTVIFLPPGDLVAGEDPHSLERGRGKIGELRKHSHQESCKPRLLGPTQLEKVCERCTGELSVGNERPTGWFPEDGNPQWMRDGNRQVPAEDFQETNLPTQRASDFRSTRESKYDLLIRLEHQVGPPLVVHPEPPKGLLWPCQSRGGPEHARGGKSVDHTKTTRSGFIRFRVP